MDKKTWQNSKTLQNEFLCNLIAIKSSCPMPPPSLKNIHFNAGIFLFLHRLTNLPDNTLAKDVLCIQIKMGLPGLAQGVLNFYCGLEYIAFASI